jgi:butyryl-CoA dehydrogenase
VPVEFTLGAAQRAIRESVREFAGSVLAPRAAALDRSREFPLDSFRRCAELGLTGIMIPQRYGGAGLDGVAFAIAIEEISRACATTGAILAAHNALFCAPLLRFGTEEQKLRFLVPHSRGERIGASCLAEPDAGPDAAAVATSAVKDGDRYVLSGRKVFVTNGEAAHAFLAYATIDRRLGPRAICAFLVERDAPGLRQGRPERRLGLAASGSVDIVFEDCAVPAANRLGGEGDGLSIATRAADDGRIGVAAQAVGISQAALDESIAYSKSRSMSGQPLASQQAIQWKLSNMATELEAARLLTYRAAWSRDQGDGCAREASIAKLFASEACARAARDAVQIHGGDGCVDRYSVERLFRDAKITEIDEGTSEVQRQVIADAILKGAGR